MGQHKTAKSGTKFFHIGIRLIQTSALVLSLKYTAAQGISVFHRFFHGDNFFSTDLVTISTPLLLINVSFLSEFQHG